VDFGFASGRKGVILKLDIGCGNSKREGFVGLDVLKLPGVDIVHDLNVFPYPVASGTIEEVWMDQVLEHLAEPLKAMEEIHRICRPAAKVTVGVPYFRSRYAVIDPTHRNFFGVDWFAYFDPNHPFCKRYAYTSARFSVNRLIFDREFVRRRWWRQLLINFAERNPARYEEKLSHLLPLHSMTFELTAVK